jgi:Nif-specific regulatory protein
LQEGEFERLGSNKTIKVDVRTVCATNADIEDLVRNRLFREDLYYRLNVLPIWAPSLADRREDIPVLARYFLMRLNQEYDKMIIIQEDQMRLLQQLEWPGNVRELENFMHRAFLMDREGLIDVEATLKLERKTKQVVNSKSVDTMPFFDAKANTGELRLETEEKQAIESALIKTKGVQIKSAKILGITLRQLRYRIKKYGIVVRKVGI